MIFLRYIYFTGLAMFFRRFLASGAVSCGEHLNQSVDAAGIFVAIKNYYGTIMRIFTDTTGSLLANDLAFKTTRIRIKIENP